VITLYKYIPAWGHSDISPFCLKVETYLRMAGIPYQSVIADVRKAPKRKLPYVDDGGTIVCDSREIIAHFEAKLDAPLDQGLAARERASSAAFRALLEEEAYFASLYFLYQVDEGWQGYSPVLKQYGAAVGVPAWISGLIFKSVRKQTLETIWSQGTGRHTRKQVEDRLCQAIESVGIQLGSGPYFFGSRPRTIDATCYGFLSLLFGTPFFSAAQQLALSMPNLSAYNTRMRQAYFEGAAAGAARSAQARTAPVEPARG
jgi:glutathione S-transferase